MKATELRIGNWIEEELSYNSCTSLPSQVVLIREDYIETDIFGHLANNEVEIENVKGIKLTTDILENVGLTKAEDNEYYTEYMLDDFCLHHNKSRNEYKVYLSTAHLHPNSEHISVNFKMEFITALHELQNAYFHITGKELETTFDTFKTILNEQQSETNEESR